MEEISHLIPKESQERLNSLHGDERVPSPMAKVLLDNGGELKPELSTNDAKVYYVQPESKLYRELDGSEAWVEHQTYVGFHADDPSVPIAEGLYVVEQPDQSGADFYYALDLVGGTGEASISRDLDATYTHTVLTSLQSE